MNKYRFFYVLLAFHLTGSPASAQTVRLLHHGTAVSLRGLSVVNDKIVWVSGNNGTVGRSVDGGRTWERLNPYGYEQRDFRDVEAFDKYTAVVMAVGEPAIILKTEDGGKRWKEVLRNDAPGMFLDAMEFWNEQSGIVIGDPVNGKFYVARTFDGGSNWRALPQDKLPDAAKGETCFAASGTNVRALYRDEACFITGGSRSRLFGKGTPLDLPLLQGSETQGANSVAVWKKRRKTAMIAVAGGDFATDTLTRGNFALSTDGGKTWIEPDVAPKGYRSCVEFLTKNRLVVCGTTGVDISSDTGQTWTRISVTGFHVCRKAKKGKAVFLAGADGRIARLMWR